MAVVNDLVTKFSFSGSTAPLQDYNNSLGSSIKLLSGFLVALNAAAAGFAVWANSTLTATNELNKLSTQTRVAQEEIQELSFIAGQMDSDGQAMQSTLQSLSQTIGSAAIQGSEDFARLGISVRDANGQVKNAGQVLDEVRQRFNQLNLSVQEQEHFASALGIDASLLKTLNATDSQMAALRDRARELGVLTAEQSEQARDYEKSLNSMWYALDSIKQLVAVGVAPEMSRLADSFTQLLADNKDWIVDGIKATISIVGELLAAFNRLLPVIGLLTAGFIAWKVASIGLAAVLGVIFSPVVLITAGVVALLAIVDDLIVAFTGGKSVIADFFKEAFDIDIVEVMTDAFNVLNDALSKTLGWFGDLFSAIANLDFGKLGSLFGIGNDRATAGATNNQTQVDNRRVEQTVSINVGADSPAGAARAIEESLQRQLDNANTQLATGGR